MSVSFVPVQCPNCGANLSVESYREYAFCSYCGTKVMINNDNVHIYRTYDEAALRQAETDRMVRLRELELKEKEANRKRLFMLLPYAVALAFILVGAIISIFDSTTGEIAWGGGILIAMYSFLFQMIKKNKDKDDD